MTDINEDALADVVDDHAADIEREQEEADFAAAAAGEDVADVIGEADGQAEHEDFDLTSIPPEAMARIEEKLTAQIEQKLSGRLRNIEGHIGGLNNTLKQLSAASKAAEAKGADSPTKVQISDAMQSGEKMAALRADFPEWAEALEEYGNQIISRIPQNVDVGAINQRLEHTHQAVQDSANRARQLARLDMTHPDWEQTIQSETYTNWLLNQPQEIQALTESVNAADAIRVLDAFKETLTASQSTLPASRRQNQRLEQALSPTSGRTVTRRQHMTEEEEFVKAFNG